LTLSIRIRLTIWYAVLVSIILALLGLGAFMGASWGLRKAADQELSSGIDGVVAFLWHKLGRHEMNDLNNELREHSALLPRGKMFRVSDMAGSIVYQPDAMSVVTPVIPSAMELRKQNVVVAGRSYRAISRFAGVGPYRFLIEVAVDQSDYQDLTMRLGWMFIFSIPLGGILAAGIGYWMSGRALSPIQQITSTASSIDARSLTRRLPLRGTGDELDRLSSTINHMLDRIAASYERIAQFTADASHELRTPVALIRSNAELLLMGANDPAQVEQGLMDIVQESDAMTRLIADLLTLARSGVEDASTGTELIELDEPVSAILPRARAQAAMREITVHVISEGQIAALRGNQKIIERVLMILIDNAVRYTPCKGKIWIAKFASHESCGFSVRDSGIGIPPAAQERIFERFYRVDAARTPRDGGSGLGLSIAKSLIELHGGSIRVESELGHGAVFEVTFPRADMLTAEAKAQAVAERCLPQ
jgi:signal transduction histidine kinase